MLNVIVSLYEINKWGFISQNSPSIANLSILMDWKQWGDLGQCSQCDKFSGVKSAGRSHILEHLMWTQHSPLLCRFFFISSNQYSTYPSSKHAHVLTYQIRCCLVLDGFFGLGWFKNKNNLPVLFQYEQKKGKHGRNSLCCVPQMGLQAIRTASWLTLNRYQANFDHLGQNKLPKKLPKIGEATAVTLRSLVNQSGLLWSA